VLLVGDLVMVVVRVGILGKQTAGFGHVHFADLGRVKKSSLWTHNICFGDVCS
jgi:hypothetical protein